MRVLFVEDNQQVAETVSLALKSRGHRCRCLLRGEPAVPLAKDEDFDIVVLDIDLPDVNGCEVLDRLRSEGVETPVLLQSGLPEEDLPRESSALGGDDFLYKPFSVDQLIARMEAAISKSQKTFGLTSEPEPYSMDEEGPPEPSPEATKIAKFAVPLPAGLNPEAEPCPPPQDQPEEEEGKTGAERRRHERRDTFDAAVITDGGRHIACAIRNISESGAALRLADGKIDCPDVFMLRQLDGPERRCQLRWRREDRMGVEFIEQAGSEPAPD